MTNRQLTAGAPAHQASIASVIPTPTTTLDIERAVGVVTTLPTHRSADIYRPDVDGLRALAVLAVILYHMGLGAASGGYVGVDVFFVISGYLIASTSFRQVADGTFTIRGFFERRVRRIAPALAAVLVVSSIAALVILLSPDLQRFCDTLLATLLFVSNVLFWRTSGYFAPEAHTLPLLHTWSLAVEEQFYLVFPLVAAGLAAFTLRQKRWVYGAVFLLSLAGCVLVTSRSPSAAFYMLPTRAWELVAGISLAANVVPVPARRAANILGAVGLSSLLFSVAALDAGSTFPGLAALVPTLGACLLIVSGSGRPVSASLLAWPPLVKLGRMSYSLYLWHWPMLVLFTYSVQRRPTGPELVGLFAAIVAVSALSWAYVEQPCRRRRGELRFSTVGGAALMASVGLIIFAMAGRRTHGYEFLQPDFVAAYLVGERDVNPDREECFTKGMARLTQGRPCPLGETRAGSPDFVLWGDSHAEFLMPLFDRLARKHGLAGEFAAASGCIPLVGVVRTDRRDDCGAFGEAVLARIRQQRIRNVLLASYWSVYTEGWLRDDAPPAPFLAAAGSSAHGADTASARIAFEAAVRGTIDLLRTAGARVWIVGQVPSQRRNAPRWAAQAAKLGQDPSALGASAAEHRARLAFAAGVFGTVTDGGEVRSVDPALALCTPGYCTIAADGRSLYSDDNHLSIFGTSRLEPLFDGMFSAMASTAR